MLLFVLNVCYLFMTLCLVVGQDVNYSESPCPDLFQYRNDGSETYGWISFRLRSPATTITIRTNFTVKAMLPSVCILYIITFILVVG